MAMVIINLTDVEGKPGQVTVKVDFYPPAEKGEPSTPAQAFALEVLDLVNGQSLTPPDRSCRVCGCTDDDCHQCIERTGEPCHWVEEDLCSACVSHVCPQCGATLVTANTNGTEEGLDTYCEECGYPDEDRPADEPVGAHP